MREPHTDNQPDKAATRPQVLMMLTDPSLEELYRRELGHSEYCLIWANSGEPLPSLFSFRYDIVCVDLSIFPSEPIKSLREIRQLSPDSEIIVLSQNEDARVAIAAFHSGINDYFLKPVNPETLTWAIEKILRRRDFKSQDEVLSADLQVFRTTHHINISENDSKMRELAVANLVRMLPAEGGIWVRPKSEPSNGSFSLDTFKIPPPLSQAAFEGFLRAYPSHIDNGFESLLTSRPEEWFRGTFAWIPMKTSKMGGLFFWGLKTQPSSAIAARIEFLIRNLELSLENYQRYVQAKQLTYIDDLTGLYNARYLDFALTVAIDDFSRIESVFCLLFIDVDHFKYVNDHYGHLVGSQLLVEFSAIVKRSVRKGDQVFRYGGDEFIAVLKACDARMAMEVGERIRQNVEKCRFNIHGHSFGITVSIGVSNFPEHGRDKRTIIKLADQAMYHGKNHGRNTVFIAESLSH